jgi:hypothetical protein
VGKQHAYVLVRDWLGLPKPVDRRTALGELGRRYLRGHGPADDRDLAKWAGVTLGDAREALSGAGSVRPGRASLPPPKLLGPFDPLLLGWASRAPIVGSYAPRVVSGGVFRPVALVGGRVAATWTLVDGRPQLRPFRALAPDERAALEVEAADVVRFLSA